MNRWMVYAGVAVAGLVLAACRSDRAKSGRAPDRVEAASRRMDTAAEAVTARYVQRHLRTNGAGRKYYVEKYYVFFRRGALVRYDEACDYPKKLLYFVCLKYFRDDFADYLDSVDPDTEFFGRRNLSPRQLDFYERCLPYLRDVPLRDTTIRVDGYNITDVLNDTYRRAKEDVSHWVQTDSGPGYRVFGYRGPRDDPEYRLVLRKDGDGGALVLVP